LLDEHTAALDPKSADQIIELSLEVIRRDRLTTLMVTHSMRQAVTLGDRLIIFRGEKKKSLQVKDLLDLFEAIRQQDLQEET
jgi:putative ABC transport system ATP-binding protein